MYFHHLGTEPAPRDSVFLSQVCIKQGQHFQRMFECRYEWGRAGKGVFFYPTALSAQEAQLIL